MTPTRTLPIALSSDVQVAVRVFAVPQRSLCSDVRILGERSEQWQAVSGRLTIELTPVFRVRQPGAYRATLRIDDAEFVNAHGARVRPPQPITLMTVMTVIAQ
jgi:hypothetical protein